MNHAEIQGNKLHKLKNNLAEVKKQSLKSILTFGGAHSNHIAALAAATKEAEINSIGIIRGDELAKAPEKWSHTLKVAQQNGMKFQFVDRKTYRLRDDENYLAELQKRYPECFIIPEGGSNHLGLLGFKDLMQQLNQQCPEWTHLYTAVGTGATLAGITAFANEHNPSPPPKKPRMVNGIAVLKQADYLIPQIENWLENLPQGKFQAEWQLLTKYYHGGYGKQSKALMDFKTEFENNFNIPLDPVYTAKAFYGFYDQLQQNHIPEGSTIILYHSGGLQGNTQQTISFN